MAICRRTLCAALLGLSSSGFVRSQQAESAVDAQMTLAKYRDAVAADEWLSAWIEEQKSAVNAVQGALVLGRFADRMYFLMDQIGWEPDDGQRTYPAVDVPGGFVTDFASIPRILWSVLPPDGDYVYAAIIHDYLYWSQHTTRAQADMIFKFAMEGFGLGNAVITPIYTAVRVGGWVAWNENATLKRQGEKRVLKSWPDDPTVRWREWKRTPDVFV